MSVRVMAWVWDQGPSNGAERLVLLALADFCDDAGRCWPAMATIAAKACVTERGARNIVRRLEADGWLKTQVGRGRGGCNTYQLVMSSPEQRAGNDVPGTAFRPEREDSLPGTALPFNRNAGSAEPSRTTKNPSSAARKAKADAVGAVRKHAAQQSVKDASGWGGGNGVNSTVANATMRWQAAADRASTLRAKLAELREREQSLTAQIEAPVRAAALRDSIRASEERLVAFGADMAAHTARATEMRERLVEIERQIEVLTAEAAETAAATGKIVSPPALAKLHAEAAIARAAETAVSRKAAQSQDNQSNLRTELEDMRQNLRFALRAATAVEAIAALDPIKMDLARAAVANAETTFTVRFDPEELECARHSIHGE